MSASIKPQNLDKAIAERLDLYHGDVIKRVDAVGEKAIKKLVRLTKADAPKSSGAYARSISYEKVKPSSTACATFIWGALSRLSRLTHLLVNGHATVNGGRVQGDPFLTNALETVLPEYEKNVEEALSE